MKINNQCNARFNRTIPCNGPYIESEGCCERHAMLFDIWIAEFNGWKVYAFKGGQDIENPTQGSKNPEQLKNWKRRQFHKWLDTLTLDKVNQLLEIGGEHGDSIEVGNSNLCDSLE